MKRIPTALTIAGSDSGGCAGIQADLKTFGALQVHGMSAITSVTAQNTERVLMATDLPVDNIQAQIDAVVEDIGVDAVKTGMLSSAEIIRAVAASVGRHGLDRLVVDPVMVTTGGDPLIEPGAIDTLKKELLPRALVVTPNLREAETLTGRRLGSRRRIETAAREIRSWGPVSVLIKGGHAGGASSTDFFYDGQHCLPLVGRRIPTRNTHGSGCTLAAAIAAYLARGLELREAVERAKQFVTEAIRFAFPLGKGRGPLGHFFSSWPTLSADEKLKGEGRGAKGEGGS